MMTAFEMNDFRAAMRNFAGAVSIVSAQSGEQLTGCTVSSLQCFTLSPPTLLLSLGRDSSMARLLPRAGRFGASLLAPQMRDIADGFSGATIAGADRFRYGRWTTLSPDGPPVVDGALVAFECRVEDMIPRHSHVIVIGGVTAMRVADSETPPLIYWRRDYRAVAVAQILTPVPLPSDSSPPTTLR